MNVKVGVLYNVLSVLCILHRGDSFDGLNCSLGLFSVAYQANGYFK